MAPAAYSSTPGADSAEVKLSNGMSEASAGFRGIVVRLREAIQSRAPIMNTIGHLRVLDRALNAGGVSPTLHVELLSEMADIAILLLPEDTQEALEAANVGNDVALELVRRNVMQLPNLARMLYTATAEALEADEGLRSLHDDFASALEIYGAFVTKGINPRKYSWAQRLMDRFSSLRELRRSSWAELREILDLGALSATEQQDGLVSDVARARMNSASCSPVGDVPLVV